jgi:hypothetical protein
MCCFLRNRGGRGAEAIVVRSAAIQPYAVVYLRRGTHAGLQERRLPTAPRRRFHRNSPSRNPARFVELRGAGLLLLIGCDQALLRGQEPESLRLCRRIVTWTLFPKRCQ